jgi:molybdopterin converting factor small subunit
MEKRASVTVRFFGSLHALRRERGLAVKEEMPLREERKALEIARELGLPVEKIATVYCNHIPRSLEHPVRPGDSVAFVPHEVPGLRRAALASPWD